MEDPLQNTYMVTWYKKYLAGWQTMQWNLEKKGFYRFLNDKGLIVTKISGCWVNTTSSWRIKQLGISFGSSNQKTMGEGEKGGYLTPLPPLTQLFSCLTLHAGCEKQKSHQKTYQLRRLDLPTDSRPNK